ncbi:hypothetical protein FOZ60_006217, partial [Perkinsus olseni]
MRKGGFADASSPLPPGLRPAGTYKRAAANRSDDDSYHYSGSEDLTDDTQEKPTPTPARGRHSRRLVSKRGEDHSNTKIGKGTTNSEATEVIHISDMTPISSGRRKSGSPNKRKLKPGPASSSKRVCQE